MTDKHIATADILMDIEMALRELTLWQAETPPASALESQQPFAVDTLTFPQWLQFMFLPRMYGLIEIRGALPSQCEIAPMAEEYFRPQPHLNGEPLIAQLHRIDRLLSA